MSMLTASPCRATGSMSSERSALVRAVASRKNSFQVGSRLSRIALEVTCGGILMSLPCEMCVCVCREDSCHVCVEL